MDSVNFFGVQLPWFTGLSVTGHAVLYTFFHCVFPLYLTSNQIWGRFSANNLASSTSFFCHNFFRLNVQLLLFADYALSCAMTLGSEWLQCRASFLWCHQLSNNAAAIGPHVSLCCGVRICSVVHCVLARSISDCFWNTLVFLLCYHA